jgi:hypothetical protein
MPKTVANGAKRTNSFGDPGWIRTSDPQLRRPRFREHFQGPFRQFALCTPPEAIGEIPAVGMISRRPRFRAAPVASRFRRRSGAQALDVTGQNLRRFLLAHKERFWTSISSVSPSSVGQPAGVAHASGTAETGSRQSRIMNRPPHIQRRGLAKATAPLRCEQSIFNCYNKALHVMRVR